MPLTRKAVFARDGGRCVYCGAAATSLDHVVPKSRGGSHTWDNVVSACSRCNHVKADRGIAELGWRLRRQPVAPTGAAWRVVGARASTRGGGRSSTTCRRRSSRALLASPPDP